MLMNDPVVVRSARALAGRVLREAGRDHRLQVARAYALAFCRPPTDGELADALAFLDRQAGLLRRQAPDETDPLLIPTWAPPQYDDYEGAALVDLCHALFNANEFLYME